MFLDEIKWHKWKTVIFSLYIALLSIGVSRHEPWFDEAQAWLLARDSSLQDLLFKYMRYEGSPALWHLILTVPAKLGLPYITMNIISALLAAMSVYLFLNYSPFPPIIKAMYPFTFFAFYQYAVVARSYSLIPLLLFSIAALYKHRIRKPFLFTLLLCLLANVSFHGLLIAIGVVVIHFFHVNWLWPHLQQTDRYKQFSLFIIFGVLVFLLKMQLEPPEDLISVAGFNYDLSRFFPISIPILSDSITTNYAVAASNSSAFSNLSGIYAKAFIVLMMFWLVLKKRLAVFLIPTLGLCLLFTIVYSHVWHQGTLFYTWLFALWLSYETHASRNSYLSRVMKPIITFSLAAVFLIHTSWAVSSFIYDYSNNYSASRETANFIKEKKLDQKKIYATNFHSISILPYFSKNIYCNYNHGQKPCFWIWSPKNAMYSEPYLSTSQYKPDFILLGIKDYNPNNATIHNPYIPEITGYKFLRSFNGALYWKNRPLETDSFALFEKEKRN